MQIVGRTWSLRPRKPGRPRCRPTPALLERVLLKHSLFEVKLNGTD
jgi:hypothetical protein